MSISKRSLSVLVACFWIAAVARAQFPIGHGTAAGTYTPSLFSEPLWLGNATFGFQIVGAPPGGTALLAVSSGRQDHVVAGLESYLDLTNVVALLPGSIDASGSVVFPVPLPGPDVVTLSGSDFYAQAAVSEPGSAALGSTQGLLLEVAHHPLLAFATSETGLVLLDPVLGTETPVQGFPAGTLFHDLVFGNGGKDLFVATTAGLFAVDTLSMTTTPLITQFGLLFSLVWDRVYNRIFARIPVPGIVWIIDGDRAHASFGTIISPVSIQTGQPAALAISSDGRILDVANNFGSLFRIDVDPMSPGYLQQVPTPPIPAVLPSVVDGVVLSPDARVGSVALTNFVGPPQTIVWRFDGNTGQWLDYAPISGLQPLSNMTDPGIPTIFTLFPARDGSRWILTSLTGVVRVDLDLNAPLSVPVSPTPMAPSAPTRTYLGLSPSARYLVQRDWTPGSGPSPNVLSLVEIATGLVTPWTTLMGTTNATANALAAWR